MKKYLLALLFLVATTFIILFFIEKNKFPVTYYNCTNTYEDCFPVAKYDNISSCQDAVKVNNWLCDSLTDPQNISCKPAQNSFAIGMCKRY